MKLIICSTEISVELRYMKMFESKLQWQRHAHATFLSDNPFSECIKHPDVLLSTFLLPVHAPLTAPLAFSCCVCKWQPVQEEEGLLWPDSLLLHKGQSRLSLRPGREHNTCNLRTIRVHGDRKSVLYRFVFYCWHLRSYINLLNVAPG